MSVYSVRVLGKKNVTLKTTQGIYRLNTETPVVASFADAAEFNTWCNMGVIQGVDNSRTRSGIPVVLPNNVTKAQVQSDNMKITETNIRDANGDLLKLGDPIGIPRPAVSTLNIPEDPSGGNPQVQAMMMAKAKADMEKAKLDAVRKELADLRALVQSKETAPIVDGIDSMVDVTKEVPYVETDAGEQAVVEAVTNVTSGADGRVLTYCPECGNIKKNSRQYCKKCSAEKNMEY